MDRYPPVRQAWATNTTAENVSRRKASAASSSRHTSSYKTARSSSSSAASYKSAISSATSSASKQPSRPSSRPHSTPSSRAAMAMPLQHFPLPHYAAAPTYHSRAHAVEQSNSVNLGNVNVGLTGKSAKGYAVAMELFREAEPRIRQNGFIYGVREWAKTNWSEMPHDTRLFGFFYPRDDTTRQRVASELAPIVNTPWSDFASMPEKPDRKDPERHHEIFEAQRQNGKRVARRYAEEAYQNGFVQALASTSGRLFWTRMFIGLYADALPRMRDTLFGTVKPRKIAWAGGTSCVRSAHARLWA